MRVVFVYKVMSPSTGLACIIQRFQTFLHICVNTDHFDKVVCTCNFKNAKKKANFSILHHIVILSMCQFIFLCAENNTNADVLKNTFAAILLTIDLTL